MNSSDRFEKDAQQLALTFHCRNVEPIRRHVQAGL
jgi:hypothetical protein